MNMPGRKYFQDESIYSDWFTRGGDDMLLRVELIDWIDDSSAVTLTFQILTKNRETTGNGSVVSAAAPSVNSVSFTIPGGTPTQADLIKTIYIQSEDAANAGLLEMVRVKASATGGSPGDWLEARIHPPIFVNRSRQSA